MKKFIKLFLVMFLVITVFSLSNVTAAEITGDFNVTSTEEETDLWYGVKHSRYFAESSSNVATGNAAGSGGGGPVVRGQMYPQQVNVLEVPSNETVKVVPWTKFINNFEWKLNTVKSMISDYEIKNPGWKVIGAINGDFFDIQSKNPLGKQPSSTHATDGEFYKVTTGNMMGFRNDGSADSIVGGLPATRSGFKLTAYNINNEAIGEYEINKVNQAPSENETSLYYSYYDEDHSPIPINVVPNGTSSFVVGDAERSLANSPDNFYGKGIISNVTTSSFDLTKGQFAVVSDNTEMNEVLASGVTIRIQRTMTGAYEGINDFMGCGANLLKNGEPLSEDVNRYPRTVVGKKADGTIVMAVIDGRQPDKEMYGAASDDMQAMMAYFGCVDAYNLDGGGSSTLIVLENGEYVVKNSPSDGSERSDSNCLLVVVKEPVINHQVINTTPNSLKFSVSIAEKNGHPIEKFFVRMNGETKELLNDEVEFDNLTSNTSYVYEFLYEKSNEELVKLITSGKALSAKIKPIFLGVDFAQEGNVLKVTPLFNDPDFATTGMYVSVNGRKTFTSNGVANINGITFNEEDSVILYFEVVLNDGKLKKVYTYYSPQFMSCRVLAEINMYQGLQISGILK